MTTEAFPKQPVRLHRGYGHAVRHFYPEREGSAHTALCALAKFDLGDGYTSMSGEGPFCPSRLGVLWAGYTSSRLVSPSQLWWFWMGGVSLCAALGVLGFSLGQAL